MTMPHLFNCRHSEAGWCLECVGEQHAKEEKVRELIQRMLVSAEVYRRGRGRNSLQDKDWSHAPTDWTLRFDWTTYNRTC